MQSKQITFMGRPMVMACDGKCEKAWGVNNRPRVTFGEDPDNFAWLSDAETDKAPDDPGTYEGGCAKPKNPDGMNKWCARECERSDIAEAITTVALPDFTHRTYNQPWLHTK